MAHNNWAHPAALIKHAKALKGSTSWYVFYLKCLLAAYPADEVFQRALADETGGVAGGVGCVHHWVIEQPNGPASKGVCKKCGATALFKNGYAAALDNTPYAKRFSLQSNKRRR
jgi:hypothetical protein